MLLCSLVYLEVNIDLSYIAPNFSFIEEGKNIGEINHKICTYKH